MTYWGWREGEGEGENTKTLEGETPSKVVAYLITHLSTYLSTHPPIYLQISVILSLEYVMDSKGAPQILFNDIQSPKKPHNTKMFMDFFSDRSDDESGIITMISWFPSIGRKDESNKDIDIILLVCSVAKRWRRVLPHHRSDSLADAAC